MKINSIDLKYVPKVLKKRKAQTCKNALKQMFSEVAEHLT